MSKRVLLCFCSVLALVALMGGLLARPGAVLATSGTLSAETPLYETPDPGAVVIALLPEGTVVTIDGPPVESFYPVTAGDLSGWMRAETLLVEKDAVIEDIAASPAPAETGEVVPGDPAVAAPVVEAASDESMLDATDPAAVAAEPMTEPVPVGAVSSELTPDSSAVAPSLPAAPVTEAPVGAAGATQPPPDPNAAPISPVPGAGPHGPASVTIDAPILLGPGPAYGQITTAPVGSAVEQTGHLIDGYVTVQFAGVTGWAPLANLGPPTTVADEAGAAEATEGVGKT